MSPLTLLTPLPSGSLQYMQEQPLQDTPHGERFERLGGLAIALFTIAMALALSLRF